MQDAENAHGFSGDEIGGQVRRAGDDEFPRAGNPARPSALRKVAEPARGRRDPLIHRDGGGGIFAFNMGENGIAIGERES